MVTNNLNDSVEGDKVGVSSSEAAISKNLAEKLKLKWGLKNMFQVFIVLLVFCLTGTTVVFLRKSLFDWLGYDNNTAWWIETLTYLLFIFPAYQILILFYGSLLGQFEFFWNKEKKLLRFMKKLFTHK